ncbi:MAG TPA: DUF4178 domain-containing protein [Longimicrobium sp.]
MTGPVANCPSCASPIQFTWSGAVQTVCGTCKSIVVRHGVDLEKVGVVSEPPPVTSRIQVGTEGRYRGRAFSVIGRIAYGWERGAWSEWHLAFGDGSSGWLSDAQDEYAVTFAVTGPVPLPAAGALAPGQEITLVDEAPPYRVTTITRARYAGVEGELPFEYWGKEQTPFVDLRSEAGRLATIDYSETPPLLFAGEVVPFGALEFRNLRDPRQKTVEGTRTLNCPNCGGTVTLQRPGESVNAVCQYCQSVLDVGSSAGLKVLQRFAERMKVKPYIPVGARGRLHGADWDVLGFQQRTIRVEGVSYSWREYLLHNPERGFRYLSEYNGHWNDITVLTTPAKESPVGGKPGAKVNGKAFRHFQRSAAETTFVLGEFPWQVRVGDVAQVDDYVDPPLLLSRERTADEESWSLGEYTSGARLWEAFKLEGRPPFPRGTFANQPSPHAGAGRLWSTFLLLFAVLVAVFLWRVSTGSDHVLASSQAFDPAVEENNVFVTEPFTVSGRASAMKVELRTDVNNSWAAFDLALVDERSGTSRELSEDVGYYHGVEDGERWSEGSRSTSARLGGVPAGTYRLVVAPQGEGAFTYDVKVTRDPPSGFLFLAALFLLVLPPLYVSMMSAGFEHQRWMESDYPPTSGDDDE